MGRRVRIVRRKDVESPKPKEGPVIRCSWCFTPREVPFDRKQKCSVCGMHGATGMEESEIRNVYIEEVDAS